MVAMIMMGGGMTIVSGQVSQVPAVTSLLLAEQSPEFTDVIFNLSAGDSQDNAIDLWMQTEDDSPDADLIFRFVGANASSETLVRGNNIAMVLDSSRFVDVSSIGSGTLVAMVEVEDPDGNIATGQITVNADSN